MPRVQHDQTHAFPHALLHALDDLVVHLPVRGVAPPGQHVGGGERLLAQTVVGLLERRATRRDAVRLGQTVGNALVHALGIDVADELVLVFVDVLTPDGDADRRSGGIHMARKQRHVTQWQSASNAYRGGPEIRTSCFLVNSMPVLR